MPQYVFGDELVEQVLDLWLCYSAVGLYLGRLDLLALDLLVVVLKLKDLG